LYKSCSKCGKIHSYNFRCSTRREYAGEERKLRSKYSWTKKSQEIREKSHNLCEVCKAQGVFTYDNIEVHHITKLKEDESKLLENENLICLCQEHHKQADKNEIDKNYLVELAKIREQTY